MTVGAGRVAERAGRRAAWWTAVPARLADAAWGGLGLLALFGLWWIGTDLVPGPGSFIRRFSPLAALPTLVDLLRHSDLPLHVGLSLKRVLVGLAGALLLGVPLGLAVGLSRVLEAATNPAFQLLRMISPLSLMPVAVMVLGVGDPPVYALLVFAAMWPILLSTASGVRQLDPAWLQLGQSLAATRWEVLSRIVIPGVLGQVLTGVRLAVGILWVVLVPCEMLGVSAGLGYFILDTRDRLAYAELAATIVLVGALGFALDAAARWLHRVWLPGEARGRAAGRP